MALTKSIFYIKNRNFKKQPNIKLLQKHVESPYFFFIRELQSGEHSFLRQCLCALLLLRFIKSMLHIWLDFFF